MSGRLAACAVPADADTVPTSWCPPLADSEFDRCPDLRVEEAEALKALSPLEL